MGYGDEDVRLLSRALTFPKTTMVLRFRYGTRAHVGRPKVMFCLME